MRWSGRSTQQSRPTEQGCDRFRLLLLKGMKSCPTLSSQSLYQMVTPLCVPAPFWLLYLIELLGSGTAAQNIKLNGDAWTEFGWRRSQGIHYYFKWQRRPYVSLLRRCKLADSTFVGVSSMARIVGSVPGRWSLAGYGRE